MTPAARVAAAIGILDGALAGAPAEKALTNWARGARYAGSGDRADVRDRVFDALRRRRSYAWIGGSETGRGLMLGALRAAGADPGGVFTGEGHAPAALEGDEAASGGDLSAAPEGVRLDLPDWLLPELRAGLGGDLGPVAALLRDRAPAFLRANLARGTREDALSALAAEGVEAVPCALAETAIEVVGNARRIRGTRAYRDGLVELQDAGSQAAVEALPAAARILDYCAGGGGKALALAARGASVTAHDADPGRMRDLPERARRAGCDIARVRTEDLDGCAPFDLVLCDVPCSGSGSWRRAPDAKWRLAPAGLEELRRLQLRILRAAAPRVAPGGALAYVTCSLLESENGGQADAFLRGAPEWRSCGSRRLSPLDGGDGFFVALFRRRPGQAGA